MLSNMPQGFLPKVLTTTRKETRVPKQAQVQFFARTGHSKAEIKEYIELEFGYALNRTCDEIRPDYYHTETCMETVPEAITAFLEGNSFEDVIRTAISFGGDCDTLTAITSSIAEDFYGIPIE